MNNVLWNILQFNPDAGTMSLVSSEWKESIDKNTQLIVEGMRYSYPAATIQDSVAQAIRNDDLRRVSDILSVSGYIPLNWDDLSRHLVSNEMLQLILPRLSVDKRIALTGRDLSKEEIDVKSPDAPKIIDLMMRKGMTPPPSIPDSIVKKTLNLFDPSKIPYDVLNYIGTYRDIDIDKYLDVKYHDCSGIPTPERLSTQISMIYRSGQQTEKFKELYNTLKNPYCISMPLAETILNEITGRTLYEYRIQGKAIAASIIHGWDHLLDKYHTIDNIVLGMADVMMREQIDPRTWKYLEYAGLDPDWYRYYLGLIDRPEGIEPSFWRHLLGNAIVTENIPLTRDLLQMNQARMNNEIRERMLNLALKNDVKPFW